MMKEKRSQREQHLFFSICFKREETAAQKGLRSICLETDTKSEKRKKRGGKEQDGE